MLRSDSIRRRLQRRLLLLLLCATVVALAGPASARSTVAASVLVVSEPIGVATGSGSQTDPHLSGSVVSYTDKQAGTQVTIKYVDLTAPGSVAQVPQETGYVDQLSEISNGVIVFQRINISTGVKAIYFYDTNTAVAPAPLSPDAGTLRSGPAIGGTTVAYEQQADGNPLHTDICISSTVTPAAPASCITTDGGSGVRNWDAAVSPDGNTVVFTKCDPAAPCQIYVSIQAAGSWTAPVAVAPSGSDQILPDTNGSVVTYTSAATGDFDVYYVPVTGGVAQRVVLSDAPGSNETNPNIAGDIIAFERTLPGSTNADIYLYEISTDTLFQLTDTPGINETLNDISIDASGRIRVVWAQPSAAGDLDIYTATFVIGRVTPSTLGLSPVADTNPVGTSHTVTATVTDASGQAVPNVSVRFSVTGSVTASGQCTSDASGQCGFTYSGPQLPGADSISAYADADNDGVHDAAEPTGEAAKAWILPFSTPGQVSGGGAIADAQGNKIAFGFSAKSGDKGPNGHCNVVDNAADVMVKCLDVTAIVKSGNAVTIFGHATVNGVATTYRIDAVDNAEPGQGRDVFSIQTASGYSRSGVLGNGNVQVK
jgi:hypothetical protein